MKEQTQEHQRARKKLYEAASRGELRARSETDILIGRSSWLAIRHKTKMKKAEGPSRQYAPITVEKLEDGLKKKIYKEPSEEIDYHEEIGEKREEAVSEFLSELETFRKKDHQEYNNLATTTDKLISSFSEYTASRKDRKNSLDEIKNKFQDFRDEIYHILFLEGYELEEIKNNLINIEQAFQEVQIYQTKDVELKKLMQTVKTVRTKLEKFENQKNSLLKSQEDILRKPVVQKKVEEFDRQIEDIAGEVWSEYNEYLNFLADRTKYIFGGDLDFKDDEILNPDSDLSDEILIKKNNYLNLKLSLDKANAILKFWESQPQQESGLVEDQTETLLDILHSCEVESINNLQDKLKIIRESVPLAFDYLWKKFPLKIKNAKNLDGMYNIFNKADEYSEAVKRNPRRLLAKGDMEIIKQYYENWFDDIDDTYKIALLKLTEDIRTEKKKFLEPYIHEVNDQLKAIDAMIKSIIQDSFGKDSRLEAVEQAMLTGTNLNIATETVRPRTLIEKATQEVGGPIVRKFETKKVKHQSP